MFRGINPYSPYNRIFFILAILWTAQAVYCQTAWYESFEGSEISWREVGGNAQYRILDHRRVQGEVHTGKGCEWLRLAANGDTSVQIAHDVGRPSIIDELMPSVWIKSDKAGLQIAARIVLPRTIDPQTGRPAAAIITGASYSDAGRWQELRITDVPRLLARQIRLLRMQLGPNVDQREAYVDAILLNINCGSDVANVWIDDLDIAGYVSASGSAQAQTVNPAPRVGKDVAASSGWAPKGNIAGPQLTGPVDGDKTKDGTVNSISPASRGFSGTEYPRTEPLASLQPKQHEVKLSGSVLTVDNRPFFPRVIEHQGEPLAVLKQLGFNTVWLKRLPAPEILEEAQRLGLWVICPWPRAPQLDGGRDPASQPGEVGPAFDAVLMWDLGSDLNAAHLETTRRWVEQIRGADRRGTRPLICRPSGELRGYSRLDNNMILLIDCRPLGTSMELADYGMWVRRQPLQALPGTPVWTTVQTQPNESLRQQIAALAAGNSPEPSISYEQMRLMTQSAIAAGSRGLLFLSSAPLDAGDAAAHQRAAAVELLNLELELVEPWAAAGSYLTTAECPESEVTATVLRSERARVVLPIWYSPGAQCVPPRSATSNLSLVVPGVPESASALELNPAGLRPLSHKRVTGGMRITLEEFALTAQVLLAHDPLVVNGLERRWAQIGRQAAQLQRELAVRKLYTVQMIAAQLSPRATVKAPTAAWIDSAQRSLQLCDRQFAGQEYGAARLSAERAMGYLRTAERFFWEDAVKELASPVTSPAALGFDTLPTHWRLIDRIRGSRLGPNQLPGGDFENLDMMFQAGWRYLKTPAPGVQTSADLLAGSAHNGTMGLRLMVTADDPQNAAGHVGRIADPLRQSGGAGRGGTNCVHSRLDERAQSDYRQC